MGIDTESGSWRRRLQAALTAALRSHDPVSARVLREAMSAIDNLGAVPASDKVNLYGEGPIAGSAAGLGATEAPRREVTVEEAAAVVAAEIAQRRAAADEYERHGELNRADVLRTEAGVLEQLRFSR